MSEYGTDKKRERRAGMAIILLLAILLASITAFARWRNNPGETVTYQVVFDLQSGIEGVQPGSIVLYGGIEIGKVRKLHYRNEELIVVAEVIKTYQFREGAQVYRSTPLIGGASTLVVTSLGGQSEEVLPNNARINAILPKGGRTTILGEENVQRVDKIRLAFSESMDGLREMADKASRIGSASSSFTEFTGVMADDIEGWRPRLDAIENRLNSISSRLNALRDQTTPLMEKGDFVARELGSLGDTLDEGTRNLGKDFDALSIDFEGLRNDYEEQVMPNLDAIISRGEASWLASQESLDRLRSLAGEGRSSLQKFIADSTLAAQQLKLAEAEIIGSLGLELLERPSTEDQDLLIREAAMGDWARTAVRLAELLRLLESIDAPAEDEGEQSKLLRRLIDEIRSNLAEFDSIQDRIFKLDRPSPDVGEAGEESSG